MVYPVVDVVVYEPLSAKNDGDSLCPLQNRYDTVVSNPFCSVLSLVFTSDAGTSASTCKRKSNSSYFTVKTDSTQAKAQAHRTFMLVLVLAASTRTRIKICSFCVIALMLALVLVPLVKTRPF